MSLNNGAAIRAKSLMCVLKKLHRPTKDQIVLISVGGLASLMALSLFFPSLIPSGVSVKPRFGNKEVSEDTFLQVDLQVIFV